MEVLKKICYVLPRYDLEDHTHFAHIHDFIVELAKHSEILLFVETSLFTSGQISARLGVKVKVLVSKGRAGILRSFFTLLKIRREGWRDFYVHYSFLSAFNVSLIVKILGGRVFYWNCGLPWNYRRSFWRETFEKLTYKMVSYLVTGTESLARQYAAHYGLTPEKIKVMPNWVTASEFAVAKDKTESLRLSLGILPGEKLLLFVHRLSPRKGADLLPEIFKNLNFPVKLVIIGGGPSRDSLAEKLKPEIDQKRVKMLGWVAHQEAIKYFAAADVFLMPSQEEGFPRVILEAMAADLPFAAFDVGGVREIVPPEFLVNVAPPDDIERFVAIVRRLLSVQPGEVNEWRQTAADWVKKYETAAVAQRFLELFD